MLTTESNLSTEIITDLSSFIDIRQEWESLVLKNHPKNLFLTHDWLCTWWEAYGSEKKLRILRFIRDNETVGYLPLMEYSTRLTQIPIQALGFVSNHWVGMDFILEDINDLPLCMTEFQRFVIRKNKTAILSYFSEHSKALMMLRPELISKNLNISLTDKKSPFIRGNQSWEEYLKNRSHRFRWEHRNKVKKIEKDEGGMNFHRLRNNFDIDKTLEELTEISSRSWQGQNKSAILSSSNGREFYKKLFTTWMPKGHLDISLLTIGGKPSAYIITFQINGYYFIFDTAFDDTLKKLSPGMIIHNIFLEEVFKDGFDMIDFGYMAEYKLRWTDEAYRITDVTLFPKGPLGHLLWGLNRYKIAKTPAKEEATNDVSV